MPCTEENSRRGSEAEGFLECLRTPFPKSLNMLRTVKKLVQGVRCNVLPEWSFKMCAEAGREGKGC